MKKFFYALLILLGQINLPLSSEIITTNDIRIVPFRASNDSLVLFNIAEVLLNTETSLGTSAWRKYIRKRLTPKQHDLLTLLVAKEVPPKVVEKRTPLIIESFQRKNIVTLAFTSRGRHEWYTTQIPNIDLLTEDLLHKIGIDFSLTTLPDGLQILNDQFSDYYHAGIIYTTNDLDKSELLQRIFAATDYRPSSVILVDDKLENLESVQQAMHQLNIPFTGILYNRTAEGSADFDPMVASIQLDILLSRNRVVNDNVAKKFKERKLKDVDPEIYFQQVIDKCDFDQLEIALTQ